MRKIIIILLVIISLLSGCKHDNTEYISYDYEYREVKFSFDYPKNWIVEPLIIWDATDETVTEPLLIREASPERGGIDLYDMEDNDNVISIFCGVSYFGKSIGVETTDLFIGKDKIADIKIERYDEQIWMKVWYTETNRPGYYQASVRVSEEYYDENEAIIMHILRSFEY